MQKLDKVNYESATDSYWLNLTPDEMQLVGALLYNIRLGSNNKFKRAALSLASGIELAVGPDFIIEASDELDIYFTLEDVDMRIGATIKSPYQVIEISGGND